MEQSTIFSEFYSGLAVAVVIIIAAAALLIMVWLAAKRILRLATAALGLVIQIKENTTSIWGLQTTNQVASNILEGAEAIDAHAGLVAEALHQIRN